MLRSIVKQSVDDAANRQEVYMYRWPMSASCNRVSSVGELWPRVDEYDDDCARVCVTVESNSDAERC